MTQKKTNENYASIIKCMSTMSTYTTWPNEVRHHGSIIYEMAVRYSVYITTNHM